MARGAWQSLEKLLGLAKNRDVIFDDNAVEIPEQQQLTPNLRLLMGNAVLQSMERRGDFGKYLSRILIRNNPTDERLINENIKVLEWAWDNDNYHLFGK